MAGLALLVALLAALVAPAGTEGDRKVSLEFNPGWNGSSVNVLHVRAEGPGDTLHFVWGSLGAPSVLLVASRSPQSRLDIDWPRLLSPSPEGALRILPPGSVSYAGAVVFTRLLEEKAPGEGFFPPYDLSGFSWEDSNATLEPRALRGQLRGAPEHDPGGAFSNGSIAFQVTAFPSLGRADVPRGCPVFQGAVGWSCCCRGWLPVGTAPDSCSSWRRWRRRGRRGRCGHGGTSTMSSPLGCSRRCPWWPNPTPMVLNPAPRAPFPPLAPCSASCSGEPWPTARAAPGARTGCAAGPGGCGRGSGPPSPCPPWPGPISGPGRAPRWGSAPSTCPSGPGPAMGTCTGRGDSCAGRCWWALGSPPGTPSPP
ncbi:glycosylated lysosomal membrane protein isoform X5 [Myiozetetes cayanensis]|uniref:glycosylated lysosomal membrane protein isoform X5 n=1 Tax=Myiozetetes cayanensis TaxID=478635 RepID=UPI002160DEF4|nr:glycosylated lysosomal membrane protein isoform X5 [Myiozetetes cayanensis]